MVQFGICDLVVLFNVLPSVYWHLYFCLDVFLGFVVLHIFSWPLIMGDYGYLILPLYLPFYDIWDKYFVLLFYYLINVHLPLLCVLLVHWPLYLALYNHLDLLFNLYWLFIYYFANNLFFYYLFVLLGAVVGDLDY